MTERNTNSINWGLLILRLGITGLLAINHGGAKFSGALGYLFGGREWEFIGFVASIGFPLPAFFAVCAALAEFVGCLFLAAGLFARYAASLIVTTMSVAVFFHLKTHSEFEFAALYWLPALFFAIAGAGRFSVDEWLRNRSKAAAISEPVESAA